MNVVCYLGVIHITRLIEFGLSLYRSVLRKIWLLMININ